MAHDSEPSCCLATSNTSDCSPLLPDKRSALDPSVLLRQPTDTLHLTVAFKILSSSVPDFDATWMRRTQQHLSGYVSCSHHQLDFAFLMTETSTSCKTFAIECSRAQVSVDMFLFSSAYQDVASLACLPHYTSGQTYYYPAFNAARPEDALKFAHEFGGVIAMPIILLAMPAVPQDQSYAIEIQIEETISAPFVVLQTVILHTTCYGERRIRVVNLALPTTSSLSEVFSSVDQVALATFFANKAVERSLTHKLEDARDFVYQKLVDILIAYRSSMTAGGAGANAQLAISENMKMLPVLILGLLKNVGIRQSAQIPPNIRAYCTATQFTTTTTTLRSDEFFQSPSLDGHTRDKFVPLYIAVLTCAMRQDQRHARDLAAHTFVAGQGPRSL
ncbi:hypothetical protein BDZ89DRAFT_309107 [Hymenopellis radicata]|nr:hypothetical protein BDZ89DRAFT_309107 [Hymenopellis radicata]